MATKPGLIPDNIPYLLFNTSDDEIAGSFPTKAAAIDWLVKARQHNDKETYIIYSPDSQHSVIYVNNIDWAGAN